MAATTNWIVYQLAVKAFVECKKRDGGLVSLDFLEEAFKKHSYSVFSYMEWLISYGLFHGTGLVDGIGYYLTDSVATMNIGEFQEYYRKHWQTR